MNWYEAFRKNKKQSHVLIVDNIISLWRVSKERRENKKQWSKYYEGSQNMIVYIQLMYLPVIPTRAFAVFEVMKPLIISNNQLSSNNL